MLCAVVYGLVMLSFEVCLSKWLLLKIKISRFAIVLFFFGCFLLSL